MKEHVINFLSQIHPLSPELIDYIFNTLKERQLKKKEIFLRPSEVSNKVSFIMQGLLRSYYITEEGVDTTVGFMKEGDVSISYIG